MASQQQVHNAALALLWHHENRQRLMNDRQSLHQPHENRVQHSRNESLCSEGNDANLSDQGSGPLNLSLNTTSSSPSNPPLNSFSSASTDSPCPPPAYPETLLGRMSCAAQNASNDELIGIVSTETLWQFLLELLGSESMSHLISWVDYQNGEFRLHNPTEVAVLWGVKKNRPQMNYDKLSRSLRYYYKKNIIKKVFGKKYVYQFCGFDPTKPASEYHPPIDMTDDSPDDPDNCTTAVKPPKVGRKPKTPNPAPTPLPSPFNVTPPSGGSGGDFIKSNLALFQQHLLHAAASRRLLVASSMATNNESSGLVSRVVESPPNTSDESNCSSLINVTENSPKRPTIQAKRQKFNTRKPGPLNLSQDNRANAPPPPSPWMMGGSTPLTAFDMAKLISPGMFSPATGATLKRPIFQFPSPPKANPTQTPDQKHEATSPVPKKSKKPTVFTIDSILSN